MMTIINWYSLREAVEEIPLIEDQYLELELKDNKLRRLRKKLLNLT